MRDEHTERSFNRLVDEAASQSFAGWDFAFLANRWREHPLPWSYVDRIRSFLPLTRCMLDMGTGGGEFLSSLAPLPPECWATEGYLPNVPIARQRLEPLGIRVMAIESDAHLPLPNAHFDLVTNRHENFYAAEVARVLVPEGRFVTQQVGELNTLELNDFLCNQPAPRKHSYCQQALRHLRDAGMDIVESHETCVDIDFLDIGAVVFYLRAIPWQLPGFTVDRYRPGLLALHREIQSHGRFTAKAHRYFIEAAKT